MENKLFAIDKLEVFLQAHWTDFFDHVRLMHVVIEHVRDTRFREIMQAQLPPRQIKVTVTKFTLAKAPNNQHVAEIWVEYSVPKEKGVVIGTSIYGLDFSGQLHLKQIFGTHFMPETQTTSKVLTVLPPLPISSSS